MQHKRPTRLSTRHYAFDASDRYNNNRHSGLRPAQHASSEFTRNQESSGRERLSDKGQQDGHNPHRKPHLVHLKQPMRSENDQYHQFQRQMDQDPELDQQTPSQLSDDKSHPDHPQNSQTHSPRPQTDNSNKQHTESNSHGITTTHTNSGTTTQATSDSAESTSLLQNSLATTTTTTPSSTASLTASPEGSSGMQPGQIAGAVIAVVAVVAFILLVIILPLRKKQKRVQRELHANPSWKIRSDPEKASSPIDPVKRFVSGVHTSTVTTMREAWASLKLRVAATAEFLKPNGKAPCMRSPFTRLRQSSNASEESPHEDSTRAHDVESGGGGLGIMPVSPSIGKTMGFIPKLPLITSKSTMSTATKDTLPESPTETIANGSLNSYPRKPSQSVSSGSTAWETQADTQSLRHPRSPNPLGSIESPSTGNLLALNPSINEIYVVERDYTPSNPGQMELRRGQRVGISQVFDNSWALCIRIDGFEAGLVPRSHLASAPCNRRVQTADDRRRSTPRRQPPRNFSAPLSPRFYTFFRNQDHPN